ncbi:MAG: DUF1122 family protein [candidate division WOR-3 bacterium]
MVSLEGLDLNFEADGYKIYIKKVDEGRFKWEKNITVFLKKGNREDFLCFVKVFLGYDYYKPWVEVFSINPKPCGYSFFGSKIEREMFKRFYEFLPKGGRLYVEYYEDTQTFNALKRDGDPSESRMGRVLLESGFGKLRNWYYPEGLREGGQKISAEKV